MKKLLCLLLTIFTTWSLWADFWTDPLTGIEWQYYISISGDLSATIGGQAYQPVISPQTSGDLVVPSEINGHSLANVDWYAFYRCENLTSITIPEGVVRLTEHAFADCLSLKYVKISSTVNFFGYSLFENCPKLKTLYLPSRVRDFENGGQYVFYNCPSLRDVYMDGDVNQKIISLLEDKTITYHVPAKYLEAWTAAVKSPSSVVSNWYTDAKTGLVYERTSETTAKIVSGKGAIVSGHITIPSQIEDIVSQTQLAVTEIEDGAFEDCAQLKSVTFPDYSMTIGAYAFAGCVNFNAINGSGWNLLHFNAPSIPNFSAMVKPVHEGSLFGELPECGLKGYFQKGWTTTDGTLVTPNSIVESKHLIVYATWYDTLSDPNAFIGRGNDRWRIDGYSDAGNPIFICEGVRRGESTLVLKKIQGPCMVDFRWKVSCDSTQSGFSFYLDDQQKKTITGVNPDWSEYSCSIPEGVHILTWKYNHGMRIFNNGVRPQVTDISVTRNAPITMASWVCSLHNGEAVLEGVQEELSGEITLPVVLEGYPVTTLQAKTLDNCRAATAIYLPETVFSVDESLFTNCLQLPVSNRVQYESSDKRVLIKSTAPLTGTFQIPDTVQFIQRDAFENSVNAERIVVPASVLSIGTNALPAPVQVDEANAVYASDKAGALLNKERTVLISVPKGITAYTIPNTVTTVEPNAFVGCDKLKTLQVPTSVTSLDTTSMPRQIHYTVAAGNTAYASDAAGALFNAAKTVLYAVPADVTSFTVEEGVTSIADGAFRNCGQLTEVRIPKTVADVDARAFDNCGALKKVYVDGDVNLSLVNSLASTDATFYVKPEYYANWKPVVPDNCKVVVEGPQMWTDPATGLTWTYRAVTPPSGGEMYAELGSQKPYVSAVTPAPKGALVIPATVGDEPKLPVKTIGAFALYEGAQVTSVKVPEGVERIEAHAFAECTALEEAVLPKSLNYLGNGAFINCVSLKKVTGSSALAEIQEGTSPFYGCRALKDVYVDGAVNQPLIDALALNAVTFHVPARYYSAWKAAVPWNCEVKSLVYTDTASGLQFVCQAENEAAIVSATGVAVRGEYTLPGTVTIDGPGEVYTVTAVADGVFKNNAALTNIVLPESVTSIGDEAFRNCPSMKRVTLPAGITKIGANAFADGRFTAVMVDCAPTASVGSNAFGTCTLGVYPDGQALQWQGVSEWNGLTMYSFTDAHYRVRVTTVGAGSVVGETEVFMGDSTTLTALPMDGSYFMGWSGDLTTVESPLKLTPGGHLSLTAVFVPKALATSQLDRAIADRGLMTKQEALDEALAKDEVFTSDEMKEMAFGAPTLQVANDTVTVEISLQTAAALDKWMPMALRGAKMTVDEAKGVLRITVPKPDANAAFYKFVVPQKP